MDIVGLANADMSTRALGVPIVAARDPEEGVPLVKAGEDAPCGPRIYRGRAVGVIVDEGESDDATSIRPITLRLALAVGVESAIALSIVFAARRCCSDAM